MNARKFRCPKDTCDRHAVPIDEGAWGNRQGNQEPGTFVQSEERKAIQMDLGSIEPAGIRLRIRLVQNAFQQVSRCCSLIFFWPKPSGRPSLKSSMLRKAEPQARVTQGAGAGLALRGLARQPASATERVHVYRANPIEKDLRRESSHQLMDQPSAARKRCRRQEGTE